MGIRDESAPKHSEAWYPGDRRPNKDQGAEEIGDYQEHQSLVQPIPGAPLRPTVGIRDESAPKHSEAWYPGDRRPNKDQGAEEIGDYQEHQSLIQPLRGAPLRPTVGDRDLSAPKHSEAWYPGDRRPNKDQGAEEIGDYQEHQSFVQPLPGAPLRPTVGIRDESAPKHSEAWYPGDRRIVKDANEEIGDYQEHQSLIQPLPGAPLRPTVGDRDLNAPKHSEAWYPGDRRINKDQGAEEIGDYQEHQSFVQPLPGAPLRPTVGVRDLNAPKHSEQWYPGDRRLFKGPGEEEWGDYDQSLA